MRGWRIQFGDFDLAISMAISIYLFLSGKKNIYKCFFVAEGATKSTPRGS